MTTRWFRHFFTCHAPFYLAFPKKCVNWFVCVYAFFIRIHDANGFTKPDLNKHGGDEFKNKFNFVADTKNKQPAQFETIDLKINGRLGLYSQNTNWSKKLECQSVANLSRPT